jgi:hypothetical protein
MKIELLYFEGCPGYGELRERLPRLLEQAGVETTIQERRIDSVTASGFTARAPAARRRYADRCGARRRSADPQPAQPLGRAEPHER